MLHLRQFALAICGCATFSFPVPALAEVQAFTLNAKGKISSSDRRPRDWFSAGDPVDYSVTLEIDPETVLDDMGYEEHEGIVTNITMKISGKEFTVPGGTFRKSASFGIPADVVEIETDQKMASQIAHDDLPLRSISFEIVIPRDQTSGATTVGEFISSIDGFDIRESQLATIFGKDEGPIVIFETDLNQLAAIDAVGDVHAAGGGALASLPDYHLPEGWHENPSSYYANIVEKFDCKRFDFKSTIFVDGLTLPGLSTDMFSEYFIRRSSDAKNVFVFWQDHRAKTQFCAFASIRKK